ncbi:serine/threonine-protein kinase, partial [Elusimicrobiota bacterium]
LSCGMGVVFEAYEAKLDRKVAIKQMRPELKTSPQLWEQFVKEAKIVSHLSHPYVVGIHDLVEQGGEAFIIFDYVEGRSLSHLLYERKRLPLAEGAAIIGYVCEAIAFAHKNNVLHRDLKPANIMVDQNGYAKVMDFGIARQAKDGLSRLTRKDDSGTPAYMAPEQHLGQAGRPADVYSIGVCLYEILTGELPFCGPDYLSQKEHRLFQPARSLVPELPQRLDVLLADVFEPDPAKRIADAPEFLKVLKAL